MKSKGLIGVLVAVLVLLVAALGVLGFFYVKGRQATPTPVATFTPTEALPPTDTATPEPTPTAQPVGDVIIPDTTKVLTGTTVLSLDSVSEDRSVLTFAGTTEQLGSLEQGDVIVAGISEKAPDGFLRKVASVTASEGQVEVQTEPATLEEAVTKGSLRVSEELLPADVQGGYVQPGVELASALLVPLVGNPDYGWEIRLDHVVLFDLDKSVKTTDDQVWADGSIRFNMALDVQLDFDWGLQYLYLAGTADEAVDIRIGGQLSLAAPHVSKKVGTYVLKGMERKIGPIPVVIKPILNVTVNVDGSASVGFEAGVKQSFSATAGVQYADKKWTPIGRLEKAFEPYPAKLTGNLDVAASGELEVGAQFFGDNSLKAVLSAHFALHANLQEKPPLRLDAGLRAVVDAYAKVFGKTIVDQTWTVIDFSLPLQIVLPVTDTPTHTPTPTWTPSPTPTWTPTPTPTWTPSPTPTGAACTFDAQGEFAGVWQKHKKQLGCPLSRQAAVLQDAEQAFERGRMFWRSDNLQIYVVYEGGALDGTFLVFTDTWDEGDPVYSCAATPPAGLVQPWRGFGKVWCALGAGAAPIGWGLAEEAGHGAGSGDPMVQEMEQGFVFRDSAGTADRDVYIFFSPTGRFVHEGY